MKATPQQIQTMREVVVRVTKALSGVDVPVQMRGSRAYVEYDSKNERPTRVVLPSIPDGCDVELINAIQGFLDHEVAHLLFTDFKGAKDVSARRKKDKLYDALYQVAEDTRIERKMQEKYTGSQYNLKNVREFVARKMVDRELQELQKAGAPTAKTASLLMPMAMRAIAGQYEMGEYMKDKWDLMGPVADILKKHERALRTLQTTQDAMKFASVLYDEIKEPPPPPSDSDGDGDNQDSESQGKGKGNNKNKKDKGKGDEKNESDQNEQGDGEGKGDKQNKKDKKGAGDKDEAEPEEQDGDDEGEEDQDEGDDDQESDDDDDADGNTSKGMNADDDAEDSDADSDDDAGGEGDSEGEGSESDRDNDNSGGCDDETGPPDGELHNAPSTKNVTHSGAGSLEVPELLDAEDIKDIGDLAARAIGDEVSSIIANTDAHYIPWSREMDYIGPVPTWSAALAKPLCELETHNMANQHSHVVQQEIMKVFRARSASRWQPGLRKGKINPSSLHRLTTNDDRIFRQRQEAQSKSVAVELVIDFSGSMGGDKLLYACTSAYIFANILDKIGIPNEIVGFTTMYGLLAKHLGCTTQLGEYRNAYMKDQTEFAHTHGHRARNPFARFDPIALYVVKEFRDRFTDHHRKLLGLIPTNAYQGLCANNVDGECVELAAQRLLQRKEARKIMIVMSDGCPVADARSDILRGHLKNVVKSVEKSNIEVLALGMCDPSVKDYYRNYSIVWSPEEIPTAILKILGGLLNT